MARMNENLPFIVMRCRRRHPKVGDFSLLIHAYETKPPVTVVDVTSDANRFQYRVHIITNMKSIDTEQKLKSQHQNKWPVER